MKEKLDPRGKLSFKERLGYSLVAMESILPILFYHHFYLYTMSVLLVPIQQLRQVSLQYPEFLMELQI